MSQIAILGPGKAGSALQAGLSRAGSEVRSASKSSRSLPGADELQKAFAASCSPPDHQQ
jgi:predicted dinucleotide-binding enzyme